MASQKIACYDVSAGKNAKISAIMTIGITGLYVFNIIFGMIGMTPYNGINELAEPATGIAALIPLIILVVFVIGGCVITPNIMAYKALNGKSQCCITAWAWCYLVMAVFVTIGIVGTFSRLGQPYMNFCAVGETTCTAQFKFQDSCNHTANGQWPGAPPQNIRVTKKYCDSKGTDFQGSWYAGGVSHVFTALLFITTNAITFYICWYKKQEFKVVGGAEVTMVTTATIVSTPVTIVSSGVKIVKVAA